MQLHRHDVVVVNFVSTLKIIVSVNTGLFFMSSSLSSEDITVIKSPTGIRTNLFKRNSSLSTVGDKYSFTTSRNALDSLITSIQSLEPISYWYNISDNSIGSLCELFRLEYCVFLIYNENMWSYPTKESQWNGVNFYCKGSIDYIY